MSNDEYPSDYGQFEEWKVKSSLRAKPWIEHLSNEHGSFKRISGRFEFTTLASDFRYGDFLFVLEDGTHVNCSKLLNFYDTFLALARLEPEHVQAFVDEINASHTALQRIYSEAHDAFMREKYPGFRRGRTPPEETKSETINVEDLGL